MGASSSLLKQTTRASIHPGHLDALNAWLRPGQDWCLSQEYPQVFRGPSRAFQHVLLDGSELIAHAITLDLDYRGHGHELSIRLIGSVVVNPTHRGQGHGSALIESLRADFLRDLPDLLMLWSDRVDFYERCGFETFGTEFILELSPRALGPRLGFLRRARGSDVPALHALHAAKPSGTRRTREDFADFLSIPACETWVLEIDAEVKAYASLGKGLDFPNHIHEVGGLDPEVASLVSTLLMEKGQDLSLLLAPYRDDLRQLLLPSMVRETHTPLGLGVWEAPMPRDFYLEGFDSI